MSGGDGKLSSLLSDLSIPRYYFPKDSHIHSLQLHGFSDASEDAYAAVVYLRSIDQDDGVHISLVIAKSRVSPIKRILFLVLNSAEHYYYHSYSIT